MSLNDFTINREVLAEKDVVVLHLAGYLDAHTFSELEHCLTHLFQTNQSRIIVDLADLQYVSSAGAGVFIGALSTAHERGGNIVLLNPAPNVREVFDLLGLSQIFQVVEDQPAALATF